MNPLFLLMRWVQTVPLSLLMFVAFEDENLRWPRWRCCLASVTYMLACSVGMALLSPASSLDGQRNIVARDLILSLFLCCYVGGWFRCIRAPVGHKLLTLGLLLHYWMILQTLGDVFSALILREDYAASVSAEAGSLTYVLCVLAATVATWPMVYVFLRRVLRKSLLILGGRETRNAGTYLCMIFLLFSVATYNPKFDLLPDTPLFVAALIGTDMIAYYILFQELGAIRRQAETARQLAEYQLQYQSIMSRMEGVRRLRHDMRHHLNVMGALNAQGKNEELAAYLQQYGKVYEQLETVQSCGDPAIDGVLGYYLAQAREEDISVHCRIMLHGASRIPHMDMTVLLGNCLENALEAVRRIPAAQRQITIELKPVGAMLLLRVVNSCAPGNDTDGFTGWQSFPSSKRGGGQGVGLRSISKIAEKYCGSAQFQLKEGTFTACVSLCMLPEEE